MTDATIRAAEILKEHRQSIDRLDAILVYTLAERFKHTQGVGKLKAEHDLPPSDPAREARQIERLRKLAVESDLDPEFSEKFIRFVIDEVIRHHRRALQHHLRVGNNRCIHHFAVERHHAQAVSLPLTQHASMHTRPQASLRV